MVFFLNKKVTCAEEVCEKDYRFAYETTSPILA